MNHHEHHPTVQIITCLTRQCGRYAKLQILKLLCDWPSCHALVQSYVDKITSTDRSNKYFDTALVRYIEEVAENISAG